MKLDEAWKVLDNSSYKEEADAFRVIKASHDKLVAALRDVEAKPGRHPYDTSRIVAAVLADLTEEQEP